MQGDTADDPAVVVGRHEELADRLVKLAQRAADHQLAVGERADQVLDGGHVTDSGGADVQSRDPQTPAVNPGVLARRPMAPGNSGAATGECSIVNQAG